jgi:sugar phosphate isomerase/epimerase
MDRNEEPPKTRQSAWEFYEHVRHAVTHVHVKDARWNEATGKADFCLPGEGEGDVARIVADLAARGYEGALSIEPHMSVVFHDAASGAADPARQRANYIDYGWRLERIVTACAGGRGGAG